MGATSSWLVTRAIRRGGRWRWRQEQRGHAILVDRHQLAAAQVHAVVADEHEERVVEEGLAARLPHQRAQRPVRVAEVVELGALEAGRNRRVRRQRLDAARRELPGRVERHGEDHGQHRPSGRGASLELREGAAEHVLVRDAPGAAESDAVEVPLLEEDVEAVADEESPHVVEDALAPVEEERVVAARAQRGREGLEAVQRLRPADRGDTRKRREGRQDRLQTLHRALAGRKAVLEQHPLPGQAVELGREGGRAAQRADQAGREALHHHQHDVQRLLARGRLDPARERARRAVEPAPARGASWARARASASGSGSGGSTDASGR